MSDPTGSPWWRQVTLGGSTGAAQVHLRSRRTREDLLVAAGREFAEHGYAGATLDAITRRSGLTKGALYFHFRSKRELADGVVAEARRRETAVVRPHRALEAGSVGDLVDATAALHVVRATDPIVRGGLRLRRENVLDPGAPGPGPLDERVVGRALSRARARGTLLPDTDPARLAAHSVAMLTGHRVVLEDNDAQADVVELRRRIIDSWRILLATAATPAWYRTWAESVTPDRPVR